MTYEEKTGTFLNNLKQSIKDLLNEALTNTEFLRQLITILCIELTGKTATECYNLFLHFIYSCLMEIGNSKFCEKDWLVNSILTYLHNLIFTVLNEVDGKEIENKFLIQKATLGFAIENIREFTTYLTKLIANLSPCKCCRQIEGKLTE